MNAHLYHHSPQNLISSIFKSCNDLKTLKQIHASLIISNGIKDHETSTKISQNLVCLYAKFGGCNSLFAVLKSMKKPDAFLWNLSIKARVMSGDVESAFHLYKEMRVMGVEHDSYTFPVINQAVLRSPESFWFGKIIHCVAFRMGFVSDVYFCNTMIEAYVKDQSSEDARKLFEEMPHRDIVSWSSTISGYVREGNATEAFTWFRKLLDEAVPKPNAVTMLVMLQVCPGAPEVGQLHSYLIKNGWLGDQPVGNSLLKTYIDLGCVADAKILLGELSRRRDIISWNIMFSLYSGRGEIVEMTRCFHEMQGAEVEPSSVTLTMFLSGLLVAVEKGGNHLFLSLLAACSHSGLLSEGCQILYSMKWKFNLEPDLDHYTCVVDLLGRSGRLKEALALILKLVTFPDSSVWGSVLAASRVHMEKRVGEYAARKLLEMDADDAGYYTLLSNLQASAEMWDEVETVRRSMKARDLIKKPGWSYIS